MPIALTHKASATRWEDVLTLLLGAAEAAGFHPRLISSAAQVELIQPRVIQDLHEVPIVICDLSGQDGQVMFELGLRLALDRPVVIIKDDRTACSLAGCPLAHLEYPYDLDSPAAAEFLEKLANLTRETYRRAASGPAYPGFLNQFGPFKPVEYLPEIRPQVPMVSKGLQATREALRTFTIDRPRNGTAARGASASVLQPMPHARPIIELRGWKSCDVHGFLTGSTSTSTRDIVITRSDCGSSHYLHLPAGALVNGLIVDLGFFAGTDSVRLLS